MMQSIGKWALQILIVVVLAYCIIYFGVQSTRNLGQSMEPTLSNKDLILINKVAYITKEPKRFDVIVFQSAQNDQLPLNIKRIVALPGETVQIIDGELYINNKKIEHKVFSELITTAGVAKEPITLGEDEYFVMGDNCNNSEDSRFSNIGNVHESDIVGKAWIHIEKWNKFKKIR